MPTPHFQTSFASGEWSPKLQSRVDIQKYHAGAALLRNFFVDYSGGGASTRQGTAFIAQAGANGARLIPFQPSTTLSYVLEFGQNYIRFYSNGAQILSGGLPYQISSPYATADLFPNPTTGNPGLKFVQDVTSLIICHPNYAPQILTINSATNWQLTAINFGPTIASPTAPSLATGNLPAGSFAYGYQVTAVDINNQESIPVGTTTAASFEFLGAANGSITFSWTGVSGAISYNVYKTYPSYAVVPPTGAIYGFIGNVTATSFTDSYPGIIPDFAQTPPVSNNPFMGGSVTGASVTAAGTYTTVPTISFAAPPSGNRAYGGVWLSILTAVLSTLDVNNPHNHNLVGVYLYMSNSVVLQVLAATNLGGGLYQITSISIINNGSWYSGTAPTTDTPQGFSDGSLSYASGHVTYTWGVGGIYINYGGTGYSSPPAITFSSGAATAVSQISVQGNPGVPSFFQERLMLGNQVQAVQTFNLSQPGSFFNFNTSNPSEDDDSITATIIGTELNDIRNLVPVPSGIVALTGKGAWLINGGGGVSSQSPITPTNATAAPQAFNGANDLKPIKINLDLLYATNKGNYVRDLTYNIYANVYTGQDISVLSNHLFFGFNIIDWAWSEEPFKVLWAVRNDGTLLSLSYVKEQELIGWAHHDTNGQFLSTCSVIENVNGSIVDAVYFIVQRFINGSYVQYVERMADRYFTYGYEDAWSVDCGLRTLPQVNASSTLFFTGAANVVGNSVTLTDTVGAPFTAGMATNSWVVRAGGGIYTITAFTSSSVVTATVSQVPTLLNPYTGVPQPTPGYTIWQPVTSVSGLTQLENASVTGVADGTVVSGTVSSGGVFTLPGTYSKITLGLAFLPQMQTLPLDLGEPTIQGRRKKIVAVTARVADTLGLQIGTTFANVVTMKDFTLGNVGTQSNAVVTGLVDGDGRTIIDQAWQEAGNYCVQQNLPYPATVLGVIPETEWGDTIKHHAD
jgi:hypothetical protein